MLIGNRHEIAASLFAPGYTMAAAIANEFTEAATDMHFSALAYVALPPVRGDGAGERRGPAAHLAGGPRLGASGVRRL